MTQHITLTLSDWVVKDIIGKPKNKSQRIEELLIKAYMAEREEKIKKNLFDECKNVTNGILSRFLNSVECEA